MSTLIVGVKDFLNRIASGAVDAGSKKLIDGFLKNNQIRVAKYLHSVFEEKFEGRGHWQNAPIHRVLLSLTRRRPRDLVKLSYGAARSAYRNSHQRISTQDLTETFEMYSNERLQDIINEFKSELPQISSLVRGMRPTTKEKKTSGSYLYTSDALAKKLKDLIQQNNFAFSNRSAVTAHTLGQFLYKIDFIMARKDTSGGKVIRKYFDENQYLRDQFVDFGFNWEVHPAYRWALQPEDISNIFDRLNLADETA